MSEESVVRQPIIVWVTIETDSPETQWCEVESPPMMPLGMVYSALEYALGLFQCLESTVDDE